MTIMYFFHIDNEFSIISCNLIEKRIKIEIIFLHAILNVNLMFIYKIINIL